MKKITKKQPWKYLFWLGPFLFMVGLTAGLVSGSWGLMPLAFMIPGIAVIIFWVVWQSQQSRWWASRSTQAGTNALIATVAVLVILGLVNFLSVRYQIRQDLTETQLFTLAPQSQELVRRLPQPVKIWVFDANQNTQDRELLENYRRQSSKFQFEYIDPQSRPGIAEKFGVKDYGEVYLESGNKRQLVQTININERLSEIRLTNRLQQLTNSAVVKAYFLQGHGERPLTGGEGAISQAVQGLTEKGYTVEPLNLVEKPQIPEDAAILVIAGAKRGLFDAEVKALQDYLNRGGNLLLMIDPDTDPKLNNLLQEWGIRLDNRLAVDVSGAGVGLGPAAPIITDYGQHPITKDFGNGISFYRLARPIEITSVTGVQSTPLLKTKPYPNSWAESDLQSEKLEFNPEKDLKGPLTLGVALTRKLPTTSTPKATPTPTAINTPLPTPTALPTPTTETQATPTPTTEAKTEQTPKESRLVVFGNSDFATDGLFQQQLNGDVFLNSVTWLSQQDQQPLSIRPKEPKNRRIVLSTTQANILTLSSLLFLPLLGFLTAAFVWWRRR